MIITVPIHPDDKKYTINKAYVDYVKTAGYIPLLVAPENTPDMAVSMSGGLLLPGGIDIDPIYYGENNYASFWCDPEKDEFERQLMYAFMKAGKPIFGICRGFQLIAREYVLHHAGQTVTANGKTTIDDRVVFEQHIESHSQIDRFNIFRRMPSHYVMMREDKLYESGEKKPTYNAVNSMHHQYLRVVRTEDQLKGKHKITPHMWATAWTSRGLDEDDREDSVVCEGFFIKGWSKSSIAAVQWHPEEMMDIQLLHKHFGKVEAAEEVKTEHA